jgi:oligoribonuclease
MPRLAAHLHYRIVDVSSVRELAKRWYPAEVRKAPRKACAHTAMADIRESLAELRWLRRAIFKPVKQ